MDFYGVFNSYTGDAQGSPLALADGSVNEETDTEYVLRKDGYDVGKYGNEITVYKDNGMTVFNGGKRK